MSYLSWDSLWNGTRVVTLVQPGRAPVMHMWNPIWHIFLPVAIDYIKHFGNPDRSVGSSRNNLVHFGSSRTFTVSHCLPDLIRFSQDVHKRKSGTLSMVLTKLTYCLQSHSCCFNTHSIFWCTQVYLNVYANLVHMFTPIVFTCFHELSLLNSLTQ